jgi:hypothetical protein
MQQMLSHDEQMDRYEEAFDLALILPQPASPIGYPVQPLWLSPAEAELLISLCVTSSTDGGTAEGELFDKLGRFVRSFGR